jgi:hypothetical protein
MAAQGEMLESIVRTSQLGSQLSKLSRIMGWHWAGGFSLIRCNWLKDMVARDGVEPPTPAFSGLRSTT